MVYAGRVSRSFAEGSQMLEQLAELEVSAKQVERVTRRIGEERVAERESEVSAYQALPLVEKFGVPAGASPPEVGVVMVDGGRIQILERGAQPSAAAQAQPLAGAKVAAESAADEAWEEAVEPAEKAGHWREDKVGLLVTIESAVSPSDPCPELPAAFGDVLRIPRLVRELKRNVKHTADAAAETDEPEASAAALAEARRYEPPRVEKRQVLASRGSWRDFAPVLAAAARAWGFQGAARRAFVGDGSANNWKLQRRCFGSFVPILDFIHALSYVFAAAMAGRKFAAGWACYQSWIAWVWQGQVGRVIAALQERQAELGVPTKDEAETSPRKVVAQALSYLRNHQDKMRYDEYRRLGLPITSSLIESVVKQVNRRVKGTEKFWSEQGGEAILQLRADHLSDDQPLAAFWQRRQATATGQRRYHRAS